MKTVPNNQIIVLTMAPGVKVYINTNNHVDLGSNMVEFNNLSTIKDKL